MLVVTGKQNETYLQANPQRWLSVKGLVDAATKENSSRGNITSSNVSIRRLSNGGVSNMSLELNGSLPAPYILPRFGAGGLDAMTHHRSSPH